MALAAKEAHRCVALGRAAHIKWMPTDGVGRCGCDIRRHNMACYKVIVFAIVYLIAHALCAPVGNEIKEDLNTPEKEDLHTAASHWGGHWGGYGHYGGYGGYYPHYGYWGYPSYGHWYGGWPYGGYYGHHGYWW